ncbi:hypothetical protein [Streptomyces sp. NPDC001889]
MSRGAGPPGTAAAGESGPGLLRRTVYFTPRLARWAPATRAVARSQAGRRAASAAAAVRPPASQRAACSPAKESARAAGAIPGRLPQSRSTTSTALSAAAQSAYPMRHPFFLMSPGPVLRLSTRPRGLHPAPVGPGRLLRSTLLGAHPTTQAIL